MPRPRKGTTADDSEASATATSIANSTPVSPSPSLNASSAAIPPPETDDVDNKEKLAAEAKAKKAEEEAAVKYHCDYCRKDISHGIRIKCAVCTDFDLCVECFSVGVEVTPHKNNHAYQVMDRVNFPLFDEHWDAEEELLLLEAIGKYGLGNWEDIADHVGTKTLAECREHYFGTYIDVASYPLPDTSNILTTSSTLAERKREADTVGKVRKRAKKVQAKPVDQASSKTLPGQRPVGVVGGAASSTAGGANYASAPVSLDQAGYMPLRREFETEYHNDAETVIAPLTFDEGDTAEETEAKYRVLELYNRKLVERYMRREFVISRNLMNLKRLYERERSLSREDRELQARLRVFIQVLSRDDFDTFVDGLVAERRLRRRIDSLQRWRAAGCRTLVAGERFAAERRRRSQDATRRGRYDSASAAAAAAANERRERLEALSRWNHKVPKPRAKPTLLSMEGLPSVELLSQRESDLCSELRLYPKQYLLVKERVLVEALENDSVLSKAQMRAIIRLDAGKLARLYDFFEKAGWINNAAQQQLAHVVAQHVASAAKTAATTTDAAV